MVVLMTFSSYSRVHLGLFLGNFFFLNMLEQLIFFFFH